LLPTRSGEEESKMETDQADEGEPQTDDLTTLNVEDIHTRPQSTTQSMQSTESNIEETSTDEMNDEPEFLGECRQEMRIDEKRLSAILRTEIGKQTGTTGKNLNQRIKGLVRKLQPIFLPKRKRKKIDYTEPDTEESEEDSGGERVIEIESDKEEEETIEGITKMIEQGNQEQKEKEVKKEQRKTKRKSVGLQAEEETTPVLVDSTTQEKEEEQVIKKAKLRPVTIKVRKLKEKEIQNLKIINPKINETQLQTEFLNYKKRYLESLEAEEIEKIRKSLAQKMEEEKRLMEEINKDKERIMQNRIQEEIKKLEREIQNQERKAEGRKKQDEMTKQILDGILRGRQQQKNNGLLPERTLEKEKAPRMITGPEMKTGTHSPSEGLSSEGLSSEGLSSEGQAEPQDQHQDQSEQPQPQESQEDQALQKEPPAQEEQSQQATEKEQELEATPAEAVPAEIRNK